MFYEVKRGKVQRVLRDVAPIRQTRCSSGTPAIFIGGPKSWQLHGSLSDGKGEPSQSNAVSHGCPPARFRGINILNTNARRGPGMEREAQKKTELLLARSWEPARDAPGRGAHGFVNETAAPTPALPAQRDHVHRRCREACGCTPTSAAATPPPPGNQTDDAGLRATPLQRAGGSLVALPPKIQSTCRCCRRSTISHGAERV